MSTRAIIAVYTNVEKGEWRGTYHHWDGYPTGLGKALWDIYHKHYDGLLSAMVEFIIDAHPEGWSTLAHSDFSLKPTWLDIDVRYKMWKEGVPTPPESYKYRGGDEPMMLDQTSDVGQEWAYVFNLRTNTMTIFTCSAFDEKPMFYTHKATVPLTGTDPDWNRFET